MNIDNKLKILIVSYNFPPVNHISALRAYSFAKYWSRAGIDVKVLCAKRNRPGIPLNKNHEINSGSHFEIIDVNYLPTKLSTHDNLDNKQEKKILRWIKIKKIANTLIQWVGAGSFINGSNLWIRPAINSCMMLFKDWPFDVILTSFGPAGAHKVGQTVKDRVGCIWVADYRDLWSGGDLFKVKWPFTVLEKFDEKRCVKTADLIVTISKPFVIYFKNTFPHHCVELIENGFDRTEAFQSVKKEPQSEYITLIYTGGIALANRDASLLFKAIVQIKKRLSNISKLLKVIFYTMDDAKLNSLIEEYGLHDVVINGGFIDRDESLVKQQNATALIFFEWNNPNIQGVLTGKLFEYLNSGRPIISIGGTGHEDASQLIEKNGYGVACGSDIKIIEDTIIKLVLHKIIPYNPNKALLTYYDRETQSKIFLEHIKKLHFSKIHKK